MYQSSQRTPGAASRECFSHQPSKEELGRLDDPSVISSGQHWEVGFEEGDIRKAGLQTPAIDVSPSRAMGMGAFSTNSSDASLHRSLRPIATLGQLDEARPHRTETEQPLAEEVS